MSGASVSSGSKVMEREATMSLPESTGARSSSCVACSTVGCRLAAWLPKYSSPCSRHVSRVKRARRRRASMNAKFRVRQGSTQGSTRARPRLFYHYIP